MNEPTCGNCQFFREVYSLPFSHSYCGITLPPWVPKLEYRDVNMYDVCDLHKPQEGIKS